jgi:phosphate starvation-inducible protein PhoH
MWKGIEFIYFNEKDVVRHHLVHMIVQAYEKHGKTKFGRQALNGDFDFLTD